MNQNKGIGAYRDRPGYFMGGMIGGAILGALVNKIQGKDWKRGAIMGGIGGGLGSWAAKSFMPAGYATMGAKAQGALPWYQKMLGTLGAKYGVPAAVAATGTGIGLGTSYVAGDPEFDEKQLEDYRRKQYMARYNRNKSMYDKWYTNPFTGEEMNPHLGWNTGGAINARPGYQYGGSSTLEYTDPDLYTPTGEGKGPTSKPILQIPLGPEPSFADEFEDLELASGPGQGDMSGWYEMYEDLKGKGELPDWMDSFEIFMQNLDVLDISPWDFAQADPQTLGRFPLVGGEMAAEGGYKKRPQYAGGGIEDLDMTGGGASFGPGTGTSDDIPAMLSDGEFVVTANAVQNLGGGDRMLGARRMYQMMNQLDPNSQTPAEMSGVGYA